MQMEAVKYSEDLVNERDQEILHIAKSIEELAQIFKELAVLVIDQVCSRTRNTFWGCRPYRSAQI